MSDTPETGSRRLGGVYQSGSRAGPTGPIDWSLRHGRLQIRFATPPRREVLSGRVDIRFDRGPFLAVEGRIAATESVRPGTEQAATVHTLNVTKVALDGMVISDRPLSPMNPPPPEDTAQPPDSEYLRSRHHTRRRRRLESLNSRLALPPCEWCAGVCIEDIRYADEQTSKLAGDTRRIEQRIDETLNAGGA